MYKISLITGDGIGPEISESAISVFNTEIADSDISGPIPSPVINDILYIIPLYIEGI